MTLGKISDHQAPVREAGGDNTVPRDGLGRPRIWVTCNPCSGSGEAVSEKTGKAIQCPSCKREGRTLRSFTRTTTYIDVLDDKSNLEAWQMRMVLVGVARDPGLVEDVGVFYDEFLELEAELIATAHDPDPERVDVVLNRSKEIKDTLNRKAQIAKKKAGAETKADKGTELHGYSELVDEGKPLPYNASFGDVIDMDAYRVSTKGLKIRHMERLVVCDELKVAGTPDRVSEWWGDGDPDKEIDCVTPLIAPDGHEFRPGELMITDLKTGTVEYGGLKMAMQLAIYAHSLLYDVATGKRESLGNINQKWGLIMNVPAGTGTAQLYWADLELGWRAVQVATQVRELRSMSKKALIATPNPLNEAV